MFGDREALTAGLCLFVFKVSFPPLSPIHCGPIGAWG
jgi:hypothetical protein